MHLRRSNAAEDAKDGIIAHHAALNVKKGAPMQGHEDRICDLEAQVRALSERIDGQERRADFAIHDAEKRTKEAGFRLDDLHREIRRLDEARDTMANRIRDLGLGIVADAKVWLIALAVLATVSLAEAIAIIVLWVRR